MGWREGGGFQPKTQLSTGGRVKSEKFELGGTKRVLSENMECVQHQAAGMYVGPQFPLQVCGVVESAAQLGNLRGWWNCRAIAKIDVASLGRAADH